MKNKVAVILGGAIGSTLSLCYNAMLNGFFTVVVNIDDDRIKIYESSKYINYTCCATESNLFFVLSNICRIYKLVQKPLLCVTSDIQCLIINKERELYAKIVDLSYFPSDFIIKSFCDKKQSGKIAQENGLCVPRSLTVRNNQDISKIKNTFTFPIILKPLSVVRNKKVGFKFEILNKDEFIAFEQVRMGKLLNDILCQEYIEGNDENYWFYLFFRNKEGVVSECMGRKTMQSNGIMAIGTTEYNTILSKLSRAFLERIGYIGIGGIEFKEFNNKYYFIEMSTRTEGFLPISDMAGASCAGSLFKSYNGNSYCSSVKQKKTVRYATILSIMTECLRNKRLVTIGRVIRLLLYRNIYFEELYYKDGTFSRYIKQLICSKIFIAK